MLRKVLLLVFVPAFAIAFAQRASTTVLTPPLYCLPCPCCDENPPSCAAMAELGHLWGYGECADLYSDCISHIQSDFCQGICAPWLDEAPYECPFTYFNNAWHYECGDAWNLSCDSK